MSRSGYTDDCENLGLYMSNVARALSGKRGQQALRDLRDALDAMPDKQLGAHSFQKGECPCTLGVLATHRGVDVSDLEPEDEDYVWVDTDLVGDRFNVARCMAAEIMFENDEHWGWGGKKETPEQRWARMRAWVQSKIREEVASD